MTTTDSRDGADNDDPHNDAAPNNAADNDAAPKDDAAPGKAGGGVLRDRDFRRLFYSTTLSQLGQQVSTLALPLVAVVSLGASELEVGVLAAMSTAAFLLIGLPAGVWVDRLRYRQILISADLIRAAALLTVPAVWWLGDLTVWHLYAVAFVIGIFSVFFDVAYQSFLPLLVGRDRLVEGNAKLETVRSVAQLGGPAAAGQLIAWLTAPVALALDAVAMGLSALFVFRMRRSQPKPVPVPGARLAAEIVEGLRFVLGNPLLRAIAASTALFNLAFSAYMTMLVFYLPQDLGLPAEQIGIIFSVLGLGGLLGAVVTRMLTVWLGEGPVIWLSTAATAPFALLMPAAALLPAAMMGGGFPVWAGAAGLAVTSLGVVVYNITQVSFRQRVTPDRLLGRMNATMRFLIWGTQPVGALAGGILGQLYGAGATLWIAGAVACLAFLPVALSPLRNMRDLPPGLQGLQGQPAPPAALGT